jgi:hypothetical protein
MWPLANAFYFLQTYLEAHRVAVDVELLPEVSGVVNRPQALLEVPILQPMTRRPL